MSALITLILSGKNDTYLVNNPEITFFKKVYKKMGNFFIETINQNFKHEFDFDKTISCNLTKIGDLLLDTYFYVKISNINKYIDPITKIPNKFVKFAYQKNLGYALISKAEIEIGGNIIETLYSDWLNIWNELTDNDNIDLDELIGNKSKYYSFSDTKDEIELYIPLNFWFKNYNLALPLSAIKFHDININIKINSKKNISIIGPNRRLKINEDIIYLNEYEIIEQNYNGIKILGLFLNFDIENKYLNYIQLNNEFIIPFSNENINELKIIGQTSEFEVTLQTQTINDIRLKPTIMNYDFDITIKDYYLVTTYAHLDIEEKIFF